jgi:putative nucleotidyltransferase with HDIG domain
MRPIVMLYVAFVLALGVAAFLANIPSLTASVLPLTGVLLLLATIAQLRPIHLTQKMKMTVEDTATFAAALLLAPGLAFSVAAGSTLLAYTRRRGAPWFESAFNASASGLSTLVAAIVFVLARSTERDTVDAYTVAAIAAGVSKYLVHTAIVDGAVALQLRRNPLTTWWRVHQRDLRQTAALYGLGALMAIVANAYPIAVALFALPVGAIFVSMRETAQLRAQTREAILAFVKLIDVRDRYTHGHSQRVAALAERIALRLRLDPSQVALVRDAALLHDLGKVRTADDVLQKPGPLDTAEQTEMRRHSEAGAELLRKLPDFWEGASLVRSHHERYDGRGYPQGLAGADVPLEAAIISVADAWDAMTSDRPYRQALSRPAAMAQLAEGRGSQWSPTVVDALIGILDQEETATVGPVVPVSISP